MNKQAKLILDMRHVAENIREYGLLAYHMELADSVEDFHTGDFYTEWAEKEMVKMMRLFKRYNDEVKELVK
jgi:hypothetical protein